MIKVATSIAKRFLPIVILAASAGPAFAENVFQYTSKPGDVVGGGTSGRYTESNADFVFSSTDGRGFTLRITPHDGSNGWDIWIAAPPGEQLMPGRYLDVMGSPREGRVGGMAVDRILPSPCFGGEDFTIFGSFGIRQVTRDADGKIVSLEADLFQRCYRADAPVLSGVLRYNAVPLSFALDGEFQDMMSSNLESVMVNDRFYGDTSLLQMYEGELGPVNRIQFNVSGKRQNWNVFITPPGDEKLKVGNYANVLAVEMRSGPLFIYECAIGSTNTLSVKKLQRDATGKLVGMYATFEVLGCKPGGEPVHGTIHYFQ